MKYQISDFDFDLPEELIAQRPAQPRDHAKLLVYNRQTQQIIDDVFYNLEHHLAPQTTLVVNNSKVEKARLRFGALEIFLLETVNDTTAVAMVRPGKKFKLNTHVSLTDDIEIEVTDVDDEGLRTLQFNTTLDDTKLDQYRLTPLPPYIQQDESLADEYQTVYADPLGSKAAPTAGLHFTDELMAKIAQKHNFAEVTLHVGLGTFAPVKEENLKNDSLHEERYVVSDASAQQINEAKHITAVGTTSLRVLESQTRPLQPGGYSTDIFIYPGYSFKSVDSLITNFHLPKSSLLMLVAAFMGFDEMMRIYQHAITEKYRFYSFGDAMLIV